MTGEELKGLAEHAGFARLKLEDITANVQPSLRRLAWITRMLWPGARLLRSLRIRSAAQDGNLRGARDQYRALRRGLWFYGMLCTSAAHRE